MNWYKWLTYSIKYKPKCFLLISCLYLSPIAMAHSTAPEHEENFILHHIKDAHEWHFATIGQTHITLPLPIIIVSKARGIEIFSSQRFWDAHHHRVAYKGYILNKNDKLVALDPNHHFYDLSITKNVAAMFMSMFILLAIMLAAAKRYHNNAYTVPRGFWGLLEMLICFVRDEIAIPNIGKDKYMQFMSYLLSVFFFIWLNNLMGLLPGAANVTGNISVTLGLAGFTFIITTIHGNAHYWAHVFNPPGIPKWLFPVMIPVEIIGLFTKPFSLMIRLFANMTAGHIILLSIIGIIFVFQTSLAGIVSVPFGTFMFLLKLIVAFLQAYIFTLLSAIYFGTAVENHA